MAAGRNGARGPTSRDIAAKANVSQATVSRVLSGHPNVRPETRERVLAVLRDTGYQPNAAARAMITRRTGTIGVVIEDITNPFYPQMLEALTAELSKADRRMILWNSRGAGERAAIESIQARVIDGVIFTAATARSSALRQALAAHEAVVLVNRDVKGAACDRVITDNAGGGRLIARYLHGCGHRRIGVIAGPRGVTTAADRERGFRDGCRRLDIELDPSLRGVGGFTHRGGHQAMTALLQRDDPPSAVFCVNDLSAFGALDAARALGVRVPEDVWVVGFDDIDMATWEAFDLTTVRQPIDTMARLAVGTLLRRIDEPDHPAVTEVLGSELVIRGSTAHRRL